MSSIYTQQVQAIRGILTDSPDVKVAKVYSGDNDNIPVYPAISVELKNRSKEVRGIGGLHDTVCTFNLWIYTNKPSYESALTELEDIVSSVEKELTKNRYLNGTADGSSLSQDTEFGVSVRGGVFLQTALMQFVTRKLGV